MSCLTHDKRFRSAFHSIINEFRNEKSMPASAIRTMPNQCCTCSDDNKETIEPVIMKEENQIIKLKDLIERINREQKTNSKLILSLNRFKNLIDENRNHASVSSEPVAVRKQIHSSSSDDNSSSSDSDITPMEISKPPVRYTKNQIKNTQKSRKPIKNGTFLFLPYAQDKSAGRRESNSLLDVAKSLQLNRFIGRRGHIALLEKQFAVSINMVTEKTSAQVTEALEKAKKGLDKLIIHNKNETMKISEKRDGEWVLIRSRKPENKTKTADIEHLLDDLANRWESSLKITKRKNNDEDDDSDDSDDRAWKRK